MFCPTLFLTVTLILQYSELKVSLAGPEVLKPKPAVSELVFGKCFTDHMFEVEWDKDAGWTRPLISPFHDIPIHPAAKVLHYAIEVSWSKWKWKQLC